MMRLLIHSFREMRLAAAIAVIAVILFSMGLVCDMTPGSTSFLFLFLCAPIVLTSSLLLYSSRYNVDFTLPVHRKTLYRCKMTAIFLAVGIGFGAPLLVIPFSRTGGLTMDMARTTVPLLAYLFASVSVSVAKWPALNEWANDVALDVDMSIVAATIVIAHGAVAVFVGLIVTLSDPIGYLLAAGMMVVCFFAYREGSAVFVRYEPVAPAGGTATNGDEYMTTRSGSPVPGPLIKAGEDTTRAVLSEDSSKGKYARSMASDGQGTIGTQVAGSSDFVKTLPAQSGSGVRRCGAGSGWGLRELPGIATTWRFLWLISPLDTRVQRTFTMLAVVAILPFVVRELTQPTSETSALPYIIMLLWLIQANASVDWSMLISLVPPAFPRRRLFSILTLTRLSPVVVGTILTAVYMSLSATVLVGTVILAFHSLVFWLGVAPSPLQVWASWTHYVLNRVFCTVGLFLIIGIIGGWGLAVLVKYPLAVRLLYRASSWFAIATPVQPSVAWQVSGACVVTAILLWVHAYERFKYMEGVPHLSRSGGK